MTPHLPDSPLETKARALRLSYGPLLDAGLETVRKEVALRTRLMQAGARDETVAQRTAARVLARDEPLICELAWLCQAMGRMESGLPILKKGALSRELARIVDPDALFLFHPDLKLPAEDPFDWAALPLPANGRTCGLLRHGSVDTHIHLGGSLAPLFYWIPLMGGGLHLDSLRGLVSPERGHAGIERWQREITCAAWRRLELAFLLSERSGQQPFPRLTEDHMEPLRGLCAFQNTDWIHRQVLEISQALSEGTETEETWTFPDPLRSAANAGGATHYAVGERKLLYGLACHLWRLERERRSRDFELEGLLRDYLLVRNAFHALLLHDRGYEGLMRFVETFGRRGFIFKTGRGPGRRRGRPRGRRRRGREMVLALEKNRMTAALDGQLLQPFGPIRNRVMGTVSEEAPRGIEMRVSIPRLRDLPKTLNAWLEGIRRHLKPEDNLSAKSGLASQVGLLFHFIKWGSGREASEDACRGAERLIYILEKFPGLRPFVVGVDAAGFERKSNPRTFLAAFHRLRKWRENLRPVPGDPAAHLGWTFHVGEDVEDFLTGLRHVDETVSLLLPRHYEGGRLGHALVLGDDPHRFYAHRGMTEPNLGSHLLDLVWAWGRLTREAVDGNLAGWLEHRIRHLGGVPSERITACYEAMALDEEDGEEPRLRLEEELLRGFFSAPGFDLGQPCALQGEPIWFEILEVIQKLLQRRIAKARICVEANPTSNLLIGGYKDYGALPYQRLTAEGIALSINTDDPGLFVTSLPGELEILYEAREGSANHRDILTWLRERLFDAEQSTFLHHVPSGEAAWRKSYEALD